MDTELLWQAMSEAIGRRVRVVRVPRPVLRGEALQTAHGWTPRVSLVGSLTKAWTAYRADGWL